MANLMGQRQLGNFRRHATVVVNKGDDARVQRSLCALIKAAYGFGIGFVFFTNAAGSTGRRRHPCQTKGAASEIPVRKHVCQTEELVISQRVQIEKIRNINVLHAKRVQIAIVRLCAGRVIINFDTLYLLNSYNMN